MKIQALREKMQAIVGQNAPPEKQVDEIIELLEAANIDVGAICNSKKVVVPRYATPTMVKAMCKTIKNYGNSMAERRAAVYDVAVKHANSDDIHRDFETVRAQALERAAKIKNKIAA